MTAKLFESEPVVTETTPPTGQSNQPETSRFNDFGDEFLEEPPEESRTTTPPDNTTEDGEEIRHEDIKKLSGNYNASEDSIISKEFQIRQDEEDSTIRSSDQKGSVRAITVVGGIGSALAASALVWFGFLAPKPPPPKIAEAKPEAVTPSPPADESAALKGQLAFAEQRRDRQESNDQEKSTGKAKPNQPTTTTKTTKPAASPAATAPRPAARVAPQPPARPVAARVQQPARTTGSNSSPQEKPIDPFERWQQLSTLGQEGETNDNGQPTDDTNPASIVADTDTAATEVSTTTLLDSANQRELNPVENINSVDPPSTSAAIQTVTIGEAPEDDPTLNEPVLSPGAQGILYSQQIDPRVINDFPPETSTIELMASGNIATEPTEADLAMFEAVDQREEIFIDSNNLVDPSVSPIANPAPLLPETRNLPTRSISTPTTQEIPLGAAIQGKVTVPIVWSTDSGTQTSERGAIELTQPLLAGDGSVALDVGTTLITQTTNAGGIPRTDVIAIVRNRNGRIQQYPLPLNILVVRSNDGGPLVGENINQVNPSLLKGDDLLVSALGGLGQVGEILNQPENKTSTSISNGRFSQSTSSQSNQPNIIGAILQGALTPASQRIANRVDERERTQQQQLRDLPDINVVPRDAIVTIVANNILKVRS